MQSEPPVRPSSIMTISSLSNTNIVAGDLWFGDTTWCVPASGLAGDQCGRWLVRLTGLTSLHAGCAMRPTATPSTIIACSAHLSPISYLKDSRSLKLANIY
ncbi:hypothetical protein E2C01_060077 [Portunus trituberculatus]|uniref:Uncharacterized protein n=1 Tax=Portunus trituberculatus TaxID=210409 RepID=A0A5B7H7W5_PORTR|nr:hypothetical protein [Portunus trituberculatus]